MFHLNNKTCISRRTYEEKKKPINFVVEKVMPQGVHFLAGHPKAGKSRFVLELKTIQITVF